MAITVEASDSFSNTVKYLRKLQSQQLYAILDKYGPIGVNALKAATPRATGETASSWYYEVRQSGSTYELVWCNSHVVHGANIALLINFGHGTGTGGYVPGKPYITRALAPVFARILLDIRKAVAP